MTERENNEEESLTLKVSLSSVDSFGSGIARMNSKHLESFGEEIPELIIVRSENNKKAIKLVSDKLAQKGRIILRNDDIEDLKIEDGDEVDILPYTNLSDDLKKAWSDFKEKFKKDDDEEEEETK